MKEFYDLAELEQDEIDDLLELATEYTGSRQPSALQGKVLALLFLNPSLRTLTSFQASMTRLGGGTFVVSPEMSIHRIETRSGIVMDGTAAEHIREAVPVIASYADGIGIRALATGEDLSADLADTTFQELRELCDIPLINLESAIRHPCQALSDWKTLDDVGAPSDGKLVFSWVYHPDALPLAVPADVAYMAVRRGMQVTLLRPPEFALPDPVVERIRQAGARNGGKFRQTDNRRDAMQGTQVLYAGSWSSCEHYGNRVAERKSRDRYENWRVDESWFENSAPDCRFMHCLPVRRGVEVEDAILDSDRSIVVVQAQNRMFTQMSILRRLLG